MKSEPLTEKHRCLGLIRELALTRFSGKSGAATLLFLKRTPEGEEYVFDFRSP